MTTITQTFETLTFTAKAPLKKELRSVTFSPDAKTLHADCKNDSSCPPDCSCKTACPPDCSCKTVCPPDCDCKTVCPPGCPCKTRSSKITQMFFYALGVVITMCAAYLMISTDSTVYLVFWVVYSVLRRMMVRSKKLVKSKTD